MPVEVDALTPPLRKSAEGGGRRKKGDGKPCYSKTEHFLQKTAGNGRSRSKQSRMARAKGRPKARLVAKAKGR